MSDIQKKRRQVRKKRKVSIRKKLSGTSERPRLTVTRSHKNIYAQVIDDVEGKTLLATSGVKAGDSELPEGVSGKCATAYKVGKAIAEMAKEKGISRMVFDRNGYLYHGRVAALARGVRDGGIEV